jgi:hypothetical protein
VRHSFRKLFLVILFSWQIWIGGEAFIREDGRVWLNLMWSVQEGVNRHHLFQDKASGGLLYSQQWTSGCASAGSYITSPVNSLPYNTAVCRIFAQCCMAYCTKRF